jgi:hypothetical protein
LYLKINIFKNMAKSNVMNFFTERYFLLLLYFLT